MADVFTNVGRGYVGGVLSGLTAQVTTFFGNVGTTVATALVGDTTLSGEVGTARISTTRTNPTTTITGDTAQQVFTYTATGGITITNAGYFTASSGGTLIQKSDHTGIPLVANDSIQYTFRAQVT